VPLTRPPAIKERLYEGRWRSTCFLSSILLFDQDILSSRPAVSTPGARRDRQGWPHLCGHPKGLSLRSSSTAAYSSVVGLGFFKSWGDPQPFRPRPRSTTRQELVAWRSPACPEGAGLRASRDDRFGKNRTGATQYMPSIDLSPDQRDYPSLHPSCSGAPLRTGVRSMQAQSLLRSFP
jgi:hypothetical protein